MTILRNCLASALVIVFLLSLAHASEIPGKKQDHPIALVGATIHPVSGPEIEHGTILFDKGAIVALGTSVDLPPGTETIDVTGKHIYPGFVDARSVIGLVEIESVRATRDITETGSINPDIHPEVAFNPESDVIPVTRANGVTTAMIAPDGGVIAGTAAAMALDGWTWEEMTIKAPVGLVVNWPSMTINKAWWEQRSEEDQKKAREKALDDIRNAFADARAYQKAKVAGGKAPVPKTDLRWESIIPALEGKIPVLVNADEIQQIESAVAWSVKEHLSMVLVGGEDAPYASSLLKEHHIPVIITPVYRTPSREWEPYDEPFVLAKELYDAGVPFCIAADGGASNERNLPYHAATAAAYGLPKEEALKAITLYPARILGIDRYVGSLEKGKDATIIVTNGDPLEITTNVEMEFIRGAKVSLESRHTRLYEKYREKYRRLGIIK